MNDEAQVRAVLERWATTTHRGELDDVLANHAPDAVIYDVLPPMKYVGTKAYRESWGEWQPQTQGAGRFELQDLSVVAGNDVAFAHGFILCGGTLTSGQTFEDLVRVTFCLRKVASEWRVFHQHVSKPYAPARASS